MKTLEKFYREVQENEELKKEFVSSFKEGRTGDFLKTYGCDASVSDVMAFLTSVKDETLSEDDLAKVAGGCFTSHTCAPDCCDSYMCE